jgi:Tfp pilus assembly protein PilX
MITLEKQKQKLASVTSSQQKGAATLLVVVILLLLMTITTLTVNRNSVMEQKMTGNDVRAREAQEAAESGLEYGVAWAAKNSITWIGNSMICPGATGCPTLTSALYFGNASASFSGEDYSISSLVFTRANATSDFIRVISTSQANVDTSITATSTVYIKPGGLLTSAGKLPPPLVMDGCMTSTTGTPDIYPSWNDIDGDGNRDDNEWADANGDGIQDAGEWTDSNGNGLVDNEMGQAIITSQPETVGGNYCLDYCGPGGGTCPSTTDTDKSHLSLNNGTTSNDEAFPDSDGDGDGTIWEYYFDVSPAQYQAAASATLSTAGGAYYVTSTGNWPGGTYGSQSNPVIIVFENGCPKPTGNTTIYGILFYAEENGCVSDPMNGWGNVAVYGSVGANGGIHKMNANLEIHGVGDGSGMTSITEIPIDASKLPGTWADF